MCLVASLHMGTDLYEVQWMAETGLERHGDWIDNLIERMEEVEARLDALEKRTASPPHAAVPPKE